MSEKPKDWGNINSYTGNREAENDKQVVSVKLLDMRDDEQRAFNAWKMGDKTEAEYEEIKVSIGDSVRTLVQPVITTETSTEYLRRLSSEVSHLFSPQSTVAQVVRSLVERRIKDLSQKT